MIYDPDDWRDVVGYEGHYRVSRFADVMSLKTSRAGLYGKILKGTISSNGYRCVGLYKDRKQINKPVHHLVAAAFIERVEGKPWINHKDSTRTNDRWDNLEWCTQAENIRHSLLYGNGAGVPRKLTDAQAEEIRARRARGDRADDIAADFKVSPTTVRTIVRGVHYIPGQKYTMANGKRVI